MMVLCSNHSSRVFHTLARDNPNRLGWLLSPKTYKRPRHSLPYALDNDAYTSWLYGFDFDELAWRELLDKIADIGIAPMWVVVPDKVADGHETLRMWDRYAPLAKQFGWPLAFVAQDGMAPKDVPSEADLLFIGGTTEFKWRTLPQWCEAFPRVHVGRCGTSAWKLRRLEQLGVESCDGSGFFRATSNGREARHLKAWLHDPKPHPELAL